MSTAGFGPFEMASSSTLCGAADVGEAFVCGPKPFPARVATLSARSADLAENDPRCAPGMFRTLAPASLARPSQRSAKPVHEARTSDKTMKDGKGFNRIA